MNRMHLPDTKSSKTTFLTAKKFTSKSADNIIKELNTVNSMDKVRGFNIDVFHGYNEFNLNALRENTRPASLNIYAKGRQIHIIKRYIKTIKQVARCTTHYVPYKRYKNLMARSLVGCIIHSRNSFPQKGSISKRLGPNKILLGKPSLEFNTKIIFFGYYAIVYTGTTKKIE